MLKHKKPILSVLGAIGIIWLLYHSYSVSKKDKPGSFSELFSDAKWLNDWPKWLDFPLHKWMNTGVDWLVENFGWFFQAINDSLLGLVVGLTKFLLMIPWPIVVIATMLFTYFISGRKVGTTVLVTLCLFFIGFLNTKFWDESMYSLALMVISIFICVLIGIPTAIGMSRSPKFRNAILPILDLMQTIPSFCYLIPGIMLFGLGAVPAIIATVIYAAPPLIRLTHLGIRMVDKEVIEAADSFGASPRLKLFQVQIPLALPNIMQGINQTTLMALAMVVIATGQIKGRCISYE